MQMVTRPVKEETDERPDMRPLSVSVKEAARLIGISPALMWRLVGDANIPSFAIRTRRLVRLIDVEDFIARRMAEESRKKGREVGMEQG